MTTASPARAALIRRGLRLEYLTVGWKPRADHHQARLSRR